LRRRPFWRIKAQYPSGARHRAAFPGMNANTVKLLITVTAITIQSNSASMIIPPFLDELGVPVAMIGVLISLGPIWALLSRIPVGMAYSEGRARLLIALSVLTMGIANFLYSMAADSLTFALIHSLSGFAYGAATTLFLAFYVDSLPPEENRSHAMGYYVGSLAVGYATGNFFAGVIADRVGYGATFRIAALLSLIPVALLWFLGGSNGQPAVGDEKKLSAPPTLTDSLKAILEPGLAAIAVVALFLNLLHQIGSIFISLYGLAVGLSLTQIGVIRAGYALCNAVARPLCGYVVHRFGHRRLSYAGMPIQAALMMLVPLFAGFGAILAVYVSAGLLRAVAIVANAAALVHDVDESRVKRGVASGMYNAAGDLGNILGPVAGGLIASATGVAGVFFVAPFGSTLLFLLSLWGLRAAARKRPLREG
jgi:predicted MFS family arabinose efflux permease